MDSNWGRLYFGLIQEIGASFKIHSQLSDFAIGMVGASMRINDRAVHQFMSCAMSAPVPVQVGFTAENNRQPGINGAKSTRFIRLSGGAAIAAGVGLGIPQRRIPQRFEIFKPEKYLLQIFLVIIMVKHHHIRFFGQLS